MQWVPKPGLYVTLTPDGFYPDDQPVPQAKIGCGESTATEDTPECITNYATVNFSKGCNMSFRCYEGDTEKDEAELTDIFPEAVSEPTKIRPDGQRIGKSTACGIYNHESCLITALLYTAIVSDPTGLPLGVTAIEVDLEDQETLIAALQNIDIVISLVGHEGVTRQHVFVKAIPRTEVNLFVPSDLGFRVDEQGLRVPVNKTKHDVEEAAREAGISTTVVLVGCFAGSSLAFPIMGVDTPGNRLVLTGDSGNQHMNLCTRNYVAEAYASMFTSTPPSQLQARAIGLSELKATGNEIASALEEKHEKSPEKIIHSLEKVDANIENCIKSGIPLALPWYCRKAWGTGLLMQGVGEDIWEVEGYQKTSLRELLVDGKLEPYRDVPEQLVQVFMAIFTN
ncbi:Uu.00g103720.m01.CDS01 [Anthostomella pinea]|uniref:Uu.00g103720.m01.CDS01 n=1 Tax=Anthostomella pinea TaxID=933095 RepID=A0AAI8VEB4_9PEZI|nr:Uu.00g103720.m01.CDS01 [Anthostomella pinea]